MLKILGTNVQNLAVWDLCTSAKVKQFFRIIVNMTGGDVSLLQCFLSSIVI